MVGSRSRTRMRRLEIGGGRHPLALSPDGGTAAVGIDGGFELVDTRSGAERKVPGAHGETPSWLLFSPDGDTVTSRQASTGRSRSGTLHRRPCVRRWPATGFGTAARL